MSPLSIINVLFIKKYVLSESEICTDQAPCTGKNSPKPFLINMDLHIATEDGFFFFTGGNIVDYGLIFFAKSDSLQLKHLNDGFVNYKHAAFHLTNMLIGGLEWCRLLVDFCVFKSAVSDGTHSLQRIHSVSKWKISPTLFQWRNNLIYILDGLRVSNFSENVDTLTALINLFYEIVWSALDPLTFFT